MRYLRLKLLKYIENNKKICDTFYHNFKNKVLTYKNNELGIIWKALFCIMGHSQKNVWLWAQEMSKIKVEKIT